MENLIKIHDLEGKPPIFGNTHIEVSHNPITSCTIPYYMEIMEVDRPDRTYHEILTVPGPMPPIYQCKG